MGQRPTKLLTDTQLRHWVAKGSPIAKSDGDGLTFTLSSAGLAAWIFRYRVGGRRAEITLGRYPDMSLSLARRVAAEKRVGIVRGEDPALERRRQKQLASKSMTVRQLIESYRAKVLPAKAQKTVIAQTYHLDKIIGPAIGSMLAREVEAADIITMIEGAKRPWTTSSLALNTANRLFAHATGRRLIPSNPCSGVQLSAILGERPPIRKRVKLSEKELRVLLPALGRMSRQNELCFRLLLCTGVRSSELFKARWTEIDFTSSAWTVPEERIKTRAALSEPFVVPLTARAQLYLRELKTLAGASNFVFPARSDARVKTAGNDTHLAENTFSAALQRLLDRGIEDVRRFTPHDLRSTVKSHLRDLGVARDISERVLNHKLRGIEGVYDRNDYLRERRAALERWEAFLLACETGAPWNVELLRKIA